MNQLTITKYWNQTNSFIKFLIVGVLNTMVGLTTTFLLLHAAGLSYWLSTFVGNTVGAICSFLLNRIFTFNSDVSYVRGGFRFLIVILVCYVCSYSLSPLIARLMSFHLLSDKNLAVLIGAMLYTLSNYMGQKYFVFKK